MWHTDANFLKPFFGGGRENGIKKWNYRFATFK